MIMKEADSCSCRPSARVEGRAPTTLLVISSRRVQEGSIFFGGGVPVSEEEFKFSYSTRRKHKVQSGSEISPLEVFKGVIKCYQEGENGEGDQDIYGSFSLSCRSPFWLRLPGIHIAQ